METGAESDRLVVVVDSMGQAEQPTRNSLPHRELRRDNIMSSEK
jgi:hypothetical protein